MTAASTTMLGFGLNVSDLDRSLDFYTRHLGMTESGRFGFPGMTEVLLKCLNRDDQPALILVARDGEEGPFEAGSGFSRLAFLVSGLGGCLDRLRAEGFEAGEPLVVGDGIATIAFTADPDGYPIELIEPGGAGA